MAFVLPLQQGGFQQQPPMPKAQQMGMPMQQMGMLMQPFWRGIKGLGDDSAKKCGRKPKSAGLEAPVQLDMEQPGTLGYMLRMTGDLRDEVALGLCSVPRPPMTRVTVAKAQSSSAKATAPIQVEVADDSPGKVSVHSSTSSST